MRRRERPRDCLGCAFGSASGTRGRCGVWCCLNTGCVESVGFVPWIACVEGNGFVSSTRQRMTPVRGGAMALFRQADLCQEGSCSEDGVSGTIGASRRRTGGIVAGSGALQGAPEVRSGCATTARIAGGVYAAMIGVCVDGPGFVRGIGRVRLGLFGQGVGGAMGSFRHAREDRATNAGQAGSHPGKGRGSGHGRSPRKIVVGRQREDAEGEAVAMEGTRVRTRGQRGGDGIEWAPSWSLALAEREARAGRRSANRGDRREGGDLPVPYYRDWDEGQSHKMVRTR